MHILTIPSWYQRYQGDIRGIFFRRQAISLSKLGHKVNILYPDCRSIKTGISLTKVLGKRDIESDEDLEVYREIYINLFPRLPNLSEKVFVKKGLSLANDYFKNHGIPDLIQAHSFFDAGILANEIKKRYNIPFVVTEHSSAFFTGHHSCARLDKAGEVAAAASALTAVSPALAKKLESISQLGKHSWKIVPNAVTEDFFSQPLNQSKGVLDFVNVGLLRKIKGQETLIKAFAKAASQDSRITLKIVGDGPERKNLQDLIISTGLPDRIHLTGALPPQGVRDEINKSDCLIISSIFETFSIVTIEALALGTPVISTRCGGPEFIITNENGMLVNKEDQKEMTESILSLAKSINRFDKEKIRRTCKEKYSEEVVSRKFEEIYIRTLETPSK